MLRRAWKAFTKSVGWRNTSVSFRTAASLDLHPVEGASPPEVGPEVLTGSTRLKAGTSQKMVLNMLSTAVMARLGHVYENLMIDMMLTNEKLAERALRILAEASGKKVSAAEHALRAAGHDMRVALVMLKLGVGAAEARKKLKAVRGDMRKALGE